jgi:hypothetical protein
MSSWLPEMFFTVGLILGVNGMVQLIVRKKTGAWKEGGASALVGVIIAGVPVSYLLALLPKSTYDMIYGLIFPFLYVCLVLVFSGVVQLSVRNKTGRWKEGGASLLTGVILAGVSVVAAVLFPGTLEVLILAGLVLAFNGAVQLGVRNKTGPWKEGGASLLAGVIIMGGAVFWDVLNMPGFELRWDYISSLYLMMAGLILLFNGVVQVCVRNKTGKWKEGGASLLAGVIIALSLLPWGFPWLMSTLSRL